ncbi:aspartyl-tRNA amidotransferase subunit B [Nitrosomonadaceae bacterium]|nr:GatB/YqeY domain-containing protein [Nitrosospira sp.]MDW7642153.1 GatB/YqeY domain-containing protein [Nitrosomonadaceae bacterium]MBI0418522.1 GatB/YqeY domain-containing protein [Nitrosospira sp.]MBI0419284.1 GatB/YqeY domain-containing protein [Nitrosospira sp.]MCX7183619.1 GatB/YqeY domain-containing protein [Nitrosospira sp.]
MSLKQKITGDMQAAMRAGDGRRRDAIRLLQAAIKQREVDNRIDLDDIAVIVVIEKMLKQRRDSIIQYEAAKRLDLADIEKYEIDILQTYMPQVLSDIEINKEIVEAIASTRAQGQQDIGKVMTILKVTLAGRADMGKVSALLKTKLLT